MGRFHLGEAMHPGAAAERKAWPRAQSTASARRIELEAGNYEVTGFYLERVKGSLGSWGNN